MKQHLDATDTSASTERPRYKPPRKPRLGSIASTISRYVQLTWRGRELRGECPGCGLLSLYVIPAYDNQDKCYYALPRNERWCCFSCGAQILGDTAEGFILFARECGLTEGKPREPLPEKLPRLWWERTLPPPGSKPDFTTSWLGAPVEIVEEHDSEGRCYGYRATYSDRRFMRWMYVTYGPHDPGHWRVARLTNRERIAAMYPEIPGEVARRIQGRDRITVAGFLHEIGRPWRLHLAHAVAQSIRALGWQQKREGTGQRQRYYVRTP